MFADLGHFTASAIRVSLKLDGILCIESIAVTFYRFIWPGS